MPSLPHATTHPSRATAAASHPAPQSRHRRIGDAAEHRALWWSHHPLFCLLAGLILGWWLSITIPLSPGLVAVFPLAVAAIWRHWSYPGLQHCCRLLLLGLLLTHSHLTWRQQALPLDHVSRLLPNLGRQHITLEATLYRPVETRGDRQYVYLQLRRWRTRAHWQTVSGRARLKIHSAHLDLQSGDVIEINKLRLYPIRNFQNPGGFDYRSLMHQRGLYAVGGVSRADRLRRLERSPQPRLDQIASSWLVRWRHQLSDQVRAYLPTATAPIFLAMVLGQQEQLSPDIKAAFRTAGAAHLLVVSGLHVGFVTLGFFTILRGLLRPIRSGLPRACLPSWRPTPLAALLCLPPVLLYCSLVGWKLSTIRAALMVGSAMLALVVSRRRNLPYALALAACLILLLDPHALSNVGFQLSFAAVAAILFIGQRFAPVQDSTPHTDRWTWPWTWHCCRQYLAAGVLTSAAAFIGTAPILLGTFHHLPTYSVLANLILVPLASVIVPLGVIALGLTLTLPAVAALVFDGLSGLLSVVSTTVQFIALLPYTQIRWAAPSAVVVIAYYSLLGSAVFLSPQRRRLVVSSLCTVVLLGGLGWQYWETRPQQLRITFLDVGTGDAILVEAPGPHYLLIDGGGTYNGRFDIGTKVVAPVLWKRFIRRFDLMAMTHLHPNHARGVVSLFEHFPTPHVLTNGSPLQSDYLRRFRTLCARRNTQLHTAQTGPRTWQWGQLHLTILSPPAEPGSHATPWQPPTENDRSLVMRLQYGDFRLLLTGDIQQATERWLVDNHDDLQAHILQIAHHGSRTSTLPDFIRRVQPQVGIISVGSSNPYGHPHPEVLDTLDQQRVPLFRTDRHGAITITTTGKSYEITPFRPDLPPLSTSLTPTR